MQLTTNQVKDILGISLRQVYYLIKTGKLKSINVSKGNERQHHRILESDLETYRKGGLHG